MLVPELKSQLIVNPARLLHVDQPTFAAQQHVDASIAVANPRFADLPDPLFQAGLTGATGFVMVSRGIEPQNLAGSPDRYAPINQYPIDQLALPDRPQSFRRITS